MQKKSLVALILICCLALCLFTACSSQEPAVEEPQVEDLGVLVLATTTSVNDSGLMDYLRPTMEAECGFTMEILSQGTGAAIETAKNGDADVLLVHSKAAEEAFVNEGYGESRIPFMYNYFVIAGPADDPAAIKALDGVEPASAAFAAIAEAKAPFASRGDDSGTHKKELKIWEAAAIAPEGDWYNSLGQGMGNTLTAASEMQAYALTDKATYLSMKDNLELEILFETADDLKNTYSMIALNDEKYADRNLVAADKFIEWMQSETASALIAEYGVEQYEQPLFFVGE